MLERLLHDEIKVRSRQTRKFLRYVLKVSVSDYYAGDPRPENWTNGTREI